MGTAALMAKDRLVRVGNNLTAFRGGFRLCGIDDVQTLDAHGLQPPASPNFFGGSNVTYW
jgi:hypothetical protein